MKDQMFHLNIFLSLIIIQPPLNTANNRLHPFPHVAPGYLVQEGGEGVQQLCVLREVVEMLVNPVFQHVDNAELYGSHVLFAKPFQILIKTKKYILDSFFYINFKGKT